MSFKNYNEIDAQWIFNSFHLSINKFISMLEDKDIQKIIEANREVFATKEEFSDSREEMRGEFSKLYTAIDAYAQKVDTFA